MPSRPGRAVWRTDRRAATPRARQRRARGSGRPDPRRRQFGVDEDGQVVRPALRERRHAGDVETHGRREVVVPAEEL